ncbi:twin-arginine translocase subunit TatC [Streptomyces sp. TRM 70351]|uniref:twin-arginine translocase subunit TatC n=1 Tax=Streptomyces sp. TRM 70351 TaxID=3116552 RepID=UPI002E7C4B2F|nr:twin-arginine translocase subunit TatC [Streptomyces sp. TRM 70351]MEE1929158.1 twin-arginine translocase subunit TatC [Streptomyces sp. TRM 70351]
MLKSARTKAAKDPEGRMPLVEHLRELRNRLVKSLLAIVPLLIVAMFYAKDIGEFITEPLPICRTDAELAEAREAGERCATLSQMGLTSPFTTYVKVALLTAVVTAAPVWLYQFWAFLAPGLHRSEKKYALSTVAFGTPLFLTGAALAHWLLPHAIPVLLGFSLDGSTNLVTVDDMIDISVKLVLAFGLAFQLPLVLILLNLGGVLSGKRMLGWWRAMVMCISVFAAMVTPTDPLSMLVLAVPITVLYFGATGFALINDRRRAASDPDADLDDDEASELDLTPETVSAGPLLPEQSDGSPAPRRGGFDDAT